jgi:coenzyme F420-reducing hydrogenase gamma subunit
MQFKLDKNKNKKRSPLKQIELVLEVVSCIGEGTCFSSCQQHSFVAIQDEIWFADC